MKHERRIPAWLLRDVPALAGMFACFWLFVIPLIAEGFRLIRGGKPDRQAFDRLTPLLLNAEATLAYALWREAYRRLGYNPRDVQLSLADLPTDDAALLARMRSYIDQIQNLSRASAHYTEVLRRRWGAATMHAADASTDALRAATHEAASSAMSKSANACVALMVSSDRRERPSNHEGVLTKARGPPLLPIRYSPHTSARPRD